MTTTPDNPKAIPDTVQSITTKTRISGHKLYLTVATHEGRPIAVFVRIAKRGSTLAGLCDAFCRSFSMAMQYGMPLDAATLVFSGMTFEPYGLTTTPEVPECTSIVDFVIRFLKYHWGDVLGQREPLDPGLCQWANAMAGSFPDGDMDDEGPIQETSNGES